MTQTLIAQASTVIDRPAADVWRALVTPASIKEYMFGTNAQSEWKQGSPITWKGEWQGKAYEIPHRGHHADTGRQPYAGVVVAGQQRQ